MTSTPVNANDLPILGSPEWFIVGRSDGNYGRTEFVSPTEVLDAADRAEAAADRAEASADRVDLGALDAAVAATAADRVQTGLDVGATATLATSALTRANSAAASAVAAAEVIQLAWTPRDLLRDGDAGLYLMPLDPDAGNLWQDVARTTPVTAAGQRVGSARIVREDGTFLYAEQSTAGNRPWLTRYPEGGRRTLLPNSAATGAVIGAPGTLPTLWGVSGGSITREIVATGADAEGHPYVDIRVTGSPGSGGVIQLSGNTDTPVLPSTTYTWSVKVSRIAGSATNINTITLQHSWRDGSGAFISQSTGAVDFKNETTHAVRAFTATSTAATAFVLPQIRLNCSGAVDITLRISGAMYEPGTARTTYQNVTFIGGGAPLRIDITEAGRATVWALLRSSASVLLPVTVPSYGTNATVMGSLETASSVLEAQTVAAGSYEVLGADGTRRVALAIVARGVTDAEGAVASQWLEARRGVLQAQETVAQNDTGAVSLSSLGYLPADGDVRTMIAEAKALSTSNTVIIPYNVAPWVSLGTLTLDCNLVFEPGARIAQNHAAVPGVDVVAPVALTGPWFTSTLFNQTDLSTVANANVSHVENARGIRVSSNDVEIFSPLIEYAAKGIYTAPSTSYEGLKVVRLKGRHLRSTEGWAAALNLKGARNFHVTVDWIEQCDRALEPEDGSMDGWIYGEGEGLLKDIYAPGHTSPGGARAAPGYNYVVSAHSHAGFAPCENIHFRDLILENCETGVWFEKSDGTSAQLPINCTAKGIVIRGNWTPSTTGTLMVEIGGVDCDVEVVLEAGAANNSRLRGLVREGNGNRLSVMPIDTLQRPFVDTLSTAEGSILRCSSPRVAQTASGNPMVRVRGPHTEIERIEADEVAHLAVVEVTATAIGSRVCNIQAKVPAVNAPARIIHLNGATDCLVANNVVDDPANLALAVEAAGAASRNLVTGNIFTRSSGAVVALGASTAENAVVTNKMRGTVTDSGAGNVVSPNY